MLEKSIEEIPVMLAYLTMVVYKERNNHWTRRADYLEMTRRLRRFWRKKEMFLFLEFLTWCEMHCENSASGLNNKSCGCDPRYQLKNIYIWIEYLTLGRFFLSWECPLDVSSCTCQGDFKLKTRFFSALGTLKLLQHVILKKANGSVYRK